MNDKPVKIIVEDTLDLHHFKPKEVPDLLNEYFSACLEKKIYSVRIIHGKGKGILKQLVHNTLKRHASVVSFSQYGSGNWGATIVDLLKQG